ncbi:leucine-rich repeat domain-containing protein [Nonomuraea sp. PA05]|uniref:STM4015 family protein n=1 Tax=Nonomuraea sp. PA05 TaxID=2604466 RepID=UPI0011DA3B03|nr:STM4015 family protein [Nonomuraea sp. PA05]TYB55032.1 leucine-rich repeat domain-containing protein [Nonomuraea sp. PA05]
MDDFEEYEDTPADPRDPGDTFLHERAVYHSDLGGDHRERFAGLPVVDADSTMMVRPDQVAWLVTDETGFGFDDDKDDTALADELDFLLRRVNPAQVTALAVTGHGAANAPRLLARHAPRLTRLRSVFLGFIEPEHWEISWIRHGDLTPLLEAYPKLERLEVRGSQGLRLEPVTHEHLRVLRFESGGLPGSVVRAVGACAFPALEHLELWLGVEQYGGDSTAADLDGILSGAGLPALKRLGLRDGERMDEVAAAVAVAPVAGRLEELSLGMGTLTDRGAEALLSGQPLTHLRVLDLRHHFLGDDMMRRVRDALPGVAVDLDEQWRPEDDGWMYVAVSE